VGPAFGLVPVGRALIALLVALALVEGAGRVAALEASAGSTTPYGDYIARVRQLIPPGARVLGLHTYWFGLEAFDYRSFIVPVFWANPAYWPAPLTFDEGLDRIAPDVLLIDPRMRAFFSDPDHGGTEAWSRLRRWMRQHRARLVGQVDDSTYGLMDVYRIDYEEAAYGSRR